jgi:recombinational DNA repair protein RecT
VDASHLLRAGFQRRIMAFISEDVRVNFINKCDRLLELSKIEMMVCHELPPEFRIGIAKFQAEAQLEVGNKGKIWKPGGPRR